MSAAVPADLSYISRADELTGPGAGESDEREKTVRGRTLAGWDGEKIRGERGKTVEDPGKLGNHDNHVTFSRCVSARIINWKLAARVPRG